MPKGRDAKDINATDNDTDASRHSQGNRMSFGERRGPNCDSAVSCRDSQRRGREMMEEAPEGLGGKLDFLEHFSATVDPRQSKKVSTCSMKCCF